MFEAFWIALIGAGVGVAIASALTPDRPPPVGRAAAVLFVAAFGGAALVGALSGDAGRGASTGLAFGLVFVAVPHIIHRTRRRSDRASTG